MQRRAEQREEGSEAYDYTYVASGRPVIPPRQESLYASVPRGSRWEVPKRNVSLLKELGSGHFGKVMKGHLKTRQGNRIVAIKMLKSTFVIGIYMDIITFNVKRYFTSGLLDFVLSIVGSNVRILMLLLLS